MNYLVSNDLLNQLSRDHADIVNHLKDMGYHFETLPESLNAMTDNGEAFAISHPIQGILKYHGFYDEFHRIPYISSISVNNGCACTISFLKLDENLEKDTIILNGKPLSGTEHAKISHSLDLLRNLVNIKTKGHLISRNVMNGDASKIMGKGLGTSASGSSALALAFLSIVFNNNPQYIKNQRLVSLFSRTLSGSGARSATGGFSLWLAHPRIDPLECYALRLDTELYSSFIEDICLITISIQSSLKTEEAHQIAPKSPFFSRWLSMRGELVVKFLKALHEKNLSQIGQLAEFDTFCMHSVLMTAPVNENIIAWDPITLKIMKVIRKMRREKGWNVYFSIDTGPSVLLILKEKEKDQVLEELRPSFPNLFMSSGKIGGSARVLDKDFPETKILEEDINNYLN